MREVLGFLVFVILILFSLFLVWFGLRNYALSRPVSAYQTPLVEEVIGRGQVTPLLFTSDPQRSEFFLRTSFENDTWQVSPKGDALEIWLQNNSLDDKTLLLFFESQKPQALPALRKLFQENNRWKHTLFCSRFDGLLEDLRELETEWSFCSGEVYLTRLLAMSSLDLEPLLRMNADIIYLHLNHSKLSQQEMTKIILEAKRQNKLVLVGPVDAQETGHWTGEKPHGWMVDSQDQKAQ